MGLSCRPLRADAARNRARVLQAAYDVFAEQGLAVPPPNRVVESVCIVEICKERTWDK